MQIRRYLHLNYSLYGIVFARAYADVIVNISARSDINILITNLGDWEVRYVD